MTLSIEARAKQLASLITHDHEIYGPRAVGAILDALRAVEVAALERAAAVASRYKIQSVGNPYTAGDQLAQQIRNLANPRDEDPTDGA